MIAQATHGEALGQRPLTDAEAEGWLFLLLTLHHLRPTMAAQPSQHERRPERVVGAHPADVGGVPRGLRLGASLCATAAHAEPASRDHAGAH